MVTVRELGGVNRNGELTLIRAAVQPDLGAVVSARQDEEVPLREVRCSSVTGEVHSTTDNCAFFNVEAVGHGCLCCSRCGGGRRLNCGGSGGGLGHRRAGLDRNRLSRSCATVVDGHISEVLVVVAGVVDNTQPKLMIAVRIEGAVQLIAERASLVTGGQEDCIVSNAGGQHVQLPLDETGSIGITGHGDHAAGRNAIIRKAVDRRSSLCNRSGSGFDGVSHGNGVSHRSRSIHCCFGRSGLGGGAFISESDGHQVLGVVTGGCVHYPQAQGVVAVSILSRIQRYADITLIRAAGDPRLGAVVAAGEQVQVPSLEVVTCRVAGDVGRAAQDCPFRDRQPVFHLRACSHRHGQERSQDGHYEYHPKQFCAEHLILPPCVWSE